MVKSVFLVLPAVAVAVAACSGTTSSSTSNSTATAAQACTDLSGSICDKIGTCAPLILQLIYGDAATCKARVGLTCPAAFSAPGSATKPSDVEACSQAYAMINCTDLIGSNQQPAACTVHGSLTAGTACADNGQCSGASGYCNITSGTCGVCSTRAAAGGTCMKNADCGTGLVCGTGTGSAMGACVTPGAAGATCDAPHPCGGGLVCVGGTCSPPAAAGAACVPAAQNCDSTKGLFCQPVTNVCASAQLAKAGDPCGFSLATSSFAFCSASGNCKVAAGTFAGTCQAAAADGAACDPTNGPSCMPPATCTNGACKISDPTSCK